MGKDWGEKFRTLASICAVLMFTGGVLGYVFKFLPFAMAADIRPLQARMTVVETGFREMRLKQTESLELQLMQQVDRVTDKLAAMGRGDPYYIQLRDENVSINQRLGQVRAELTVLRGSAQ